MSDAAISGSRKALNRLRRALEKTTSELRKLQGSLSHAEGDDFPTADYDKAREELESVNKFVEEEAQRLQAKILAAGGLEPGRVRRGD